jgi:acyl carrier protein
MSVNDRLLAVVNTVRANKSQSPLPTLDSGMSLRDDLQLDSLDLAELTVRIDKEFGVDVFEDGLVETVGEVIGKLGG